MVADNQILAKINFIFESIQLSVNYSNLDNQNSFSGTLSTKNVELNGPSSARSLQSS